MNIKSIFKDKYFLFTVTSIIITFLLIYLIRSSSTYLGTDFGVDVYYHVKAGDIFPFISTTKQFPWAEMSIWHTTFSDKELGFHFLLFLLLKINSAIGVSFYPPFNAISSFFFGVILLLFGTWGYFQSKKTAFIAPILLAFISPSFFQKLIILRPDLVSIILFSLTVFILLSKYSFNKKIIYIFIISWIYSLSYSVPFIILTPISIYCISLCFSQISKIDKIKNFLIILISILGLILGLTIHPQFPNTFNTLYIQGYQVIMNILGLSGSKVGLGEGLKAPGFNAIIQNSLVFILLVLNIIFYKLTSKKTTKNNGNRLFIILLQLITILAFFFSKRAIEYAVPSAIMSFIYLTASCEKESDKIPQALTNRFYAAIILLVVLLLVMVPINKRQLNQMIKLPPFYAFAKWAKNNIPDNTYIGLINFGDFPRLFYVTLRYKYSMAMDPMFSYYAYPERSNIIEQFRLGYDFKITPKELAKAYGTNYLFCSKHDQQPAMYLLDKGATLIYYDKEGCLLRL